MTPAIHPQLQTILEELKATSQSAETMQAIANAEQFQARPRPDTWSAAECIRHLSLTTAAYLPLLDSLLHAGKTRPVRYRKDVLGAILCWVIEPPSRIKSKTAAAFIPSGGMDKTAVLAEFAAAQAELIKRIKQADGLDLNRLRMVSPFNNRVTYNVYSGFKILAAHQRRHLWQAEQALASIMA